MHFTEIESRELRVPVQRAHVEVQTERDSRRAVIFLAPDARPAAFFEESAEFFPAEEDGAIRLYARSSVVSLVVDAEDGSAASLELHGVRYEPRPIAVHLRNGGILRGDLCALSRRTRTLDLVNETGKSLAVRVDGRMVHVAKAHVERIEEVS